jgi:type II secretory ATPase GspE/PulE/Tfp pilus assembly ATPase PilB-like protein
MNCDSARIEIVAYLKNELEAGKRKRLEDHLAKCPDCRRELNKARRLLTWTEAASDEAVIGKVEEIFRGGLTSGASDIHFESQRDDTLLVRNRVDGVLHEVARFDSAQRTGILARVKMLADLNVADTSLPQDGRIKWSFGDKEYDLRVSTIPYVYGEGIVIRILDKSGVLVGLDKLGFYPEQIQALEHLIWQPSGQLILSGPTGSGKTTTMYSILMTLVSPEKKVLTVEDPVEYSLPGVNQVHVNKRAGLTFETAMRAFFRHDPDIIMIGETRNLETALAGVEAAMTGHLVLSQLHANDAPGVITRLADMGVEPYLIAATLLGAVSQRLARKVCQECGEGIEADTNDPAIRFLGITAWDLKEHTIRRGKGCDRCRRTGYKGRTGLYEILTLTSELRALIVNGATGVEIIEAARSQGFLDMRADAKRKVLDGITTPEEAFRVLQPW